MPWRKKGLIYCPDGSSDWRHNSVLTPQPFLLTDEIIRIYASFRDKSGVGRIGYIDVEARNPAHIITISEQPILDIGPDGCFDDNGLILGDVIRVDDKIYMYYIAFQLVKKVKFLAFSGLAISSDGGDNFQRCQPVPVLDRASERLFGGAIHSVIIEHGKFRVWYAVIYDWTIINKVSYPIYNIKYTESENGMDFPKEGLTCVRCVGNEYRIGRPKVRKKNGIYEMRYTSDTLDKQYTAGYAESEDGIHWVRKDELGWLKKSGRGFDSEMACYPVVQETKYGTYMFYSGNGMGEAGFGYAELIEE